MRNYTVNYPNTGRSFTFSKPSEVMVLLNASEEPFLIKYKGENLVYTKFLDYLAKGIV